MLKRPAFFFVMMSLVALVSFAACSGSKAKPSVVSDCGKYGKCCFESGLCNEGLECEEGICVFPAVKDGDSEAEPDPDTCNCKEGEVCQAGNCVVPADNDSDTDADLDSDTRDTDETEAESDTEVIEHGPLLVFSQTTLDFGLMAVGASNKRTLTYSNKGDASLTIYTARLDQEQPASGIFSLESAIQTPLTLAPGEELTLVIVFARGLDGEALSHMNFLSNDRENSQKRVLLYSQKAGKVKLELDKEGVDLGAIGVGQSATPQTLTITNTVSGDGAGTLIVSKLEFLQADPVFALDRTGLALPKELAPGEKLVLTLLATPNKAGTISGTLLVNHNDSQLAFPLGVPLQVVGLVPELAIDPPTYDFGTVGLGEHPLVTFTLTNKGGLPLIIGPEGAAPYFTSLSDTRAFALDLDLDADSQPDMTFPVTLAPGATQLLGVRFSPWELRDTFTASLIVPTNAPANPDAQIDLKGAGIPPALSVTPGSLEFGCVQVGQGNPQTLKIGYGGAEKLSLTQVIITPSGTFSLVNPPSFPQVLSSEATVDLTLNYRPLQVTDNQTATLTLKLATDSGSAVNFQVPMSGCGIASKLRLDFDSDTAFQNVQILPRHLTDMLPEQQAKWVAREHVTLTNIGLAPLRIADIVPDAGNNASWSMTEDWLPEVPPGGTTGFDILWAPEELTSMTARFVICSDAINGQSGAVECGAGSGLGAYDITLLNRSPIDPRIEVYPDTLVFDDVLTGQSGSQIITIRNRGTGPFTLEALSFTGENATSFALGQVYPEECKRSCSLDRNQAATVEVLFSPTDTGPKVATLDIQHTVKAADRTGNRDEHDYPIFSVSLRGNAGTNTPPIAMAKSYLQGTTDPVCRYACSYPTGSTVVFSALDSFDGDAGDAVVGYRWSVSPVKEGLSILSGNNGTYYTLKFGAPGVYTIDLLVADSKGLPSAPSADSRIVVTVQGDPVAIASAVDYEHQTQITVSAKKSIFLDGGLSYDSDGTIAQYRWFVRNKADNSETLFSNDVAPTYVFPEKGLFAIELEVVDNDGRVSPTRSVIDFTVLANDSIKIEVTWAGGGDVNVHWIRPNGGAFGAGTSDCNAAQPNPDWTPQGFGHPHFTQASTNGISPEIITHGDPGEDGGFQLAMQYVTPVKRIVNVVKCERSEYDCDRCGCSCFFLFCDIKVFDCCDSCDICTTTPTEQVVPVQPLVKVYLNGATSPDYIFSGEGTQIDDANGIRSLVFSRQDGEFKL